MTSNTTPDQLLASLVVAGGMREDWTVRPDQIVTKSFRWHWGDMGWSMSLVQAIAIAMAGVGAGAGWVAGDIEGGAMLGYIGGVFVGTGWMLVAHMTSATEERRWNESQQQVFVKPTNQVKRVDGDGDSSTE